MENAGKYAGKMLNLEFYSCLMHLVLKMLVFENKLKSLKVAQVKDEIDDDEDDGCDVVL